MENITMSEVKKQSKSVLEKGILLSKDGIVANHSMIVEGVISAPLSCLETIEIEKGAVIKNNVYAKDIIVRGTVYGSIYARNTLRICQGGKVYGKISYRDLEIEKSSVLVGSSEIINEARIDRYFKSLKFKDAE